jgi:hypothetical protein
MYEILFSIFLPRFRNQVAHSPPPPKKTKILVSYDDDQLIYEFSSEASPLMDTAHSPLTIKTQRFGSSCFSLMVREIKQPGSTHLKTEAEAASETSCFNPRRRWPSSTKQGVFQNIKYHLHSPEDLHYNFLGCHSALPGTDVLEQRAASLLQWETGRSSETVKPIY